MTVVAVCSGKAAPGATSVAVALARTWPGRVLLVDADPAGGDMVAGLLAGVDANRGLVSWAVATRRMSTLAALAELGLHAMAVQLAGSAEQQRVWLLPGLQAAGQGSALAGGGWARLAQVLRAPWPDQAPRDVVVDTGRLCEGSPWPLIRAAARVLLVLRPTARSVMAACEAVEMLRANADPASVVSLVVNGSGPYTTRHVSRVLDLPVAAVLPGDAKGAAVLVDGEPEPMFGWARTPLARAVTGLAAEVATPMPLLERAKDAP